MRQIFLHALPQEEAQKVVRRVIDDYCERFQEYDPRVRWLDPNQAQIEFEADGERVGGSVTVGDREIEVELDVLESFGEFKGRAMPYLERDLRMRLRS